jgi:hypothetical protein
MDYEKLVTELNDEMHDRYGEIEVFFVYTTTGYYSFIGFGNVTLWNSEDEEREWIEKNNDYEPMKPFLEKELKKYAETLSLFSSHILVNTSL